MAGIALLCATRRGLRFLQRLVTLVPANKLLVVSFPEEPGEPPFLDDIRSLAVARGARFIEARQVGSDRLASIWDDPPDVLLAVSWRYMVPPRVYRRARNGAYVFHDSMLPSYRGFSPTVWAMVNGEEQTGVTLFEMAEEVDAGAIIDQRGVAIGDEDTIATVMDRVTQAYLELLDANLPALLAGTAPRREQDHSLATYTCKRNASDGRIDWAAASRTIHNLVRAHTKPYWGAFTTLDGRELKVWQCRIEAGGRPYVGRVAGRVIEIRPGVGSVILTGDGAILVTQLQLDDETICAADVLNSIGITLGT